MVSSVSPKKSKRSGSARAWREHVDQAAAHRELAGRAHGGGAAVAVDDEIAFELLHRRFFAGVARERGLAHALRAAARAGRRPTRWRSTSSGASLLGAPRQLRERRAALRRDGRGWRDAVVGQRVPRRQAQRRELRREERAPPPRTATARVSSRATNSVTPPRMTRGFGQGRRVHALGRAGDDQRVLRLRQRLDQALKRERGLSSGGFGHLEAERADRRASGWRVVVSAARAPAGDPVIDVLVGGIEQPRTRPTPVSSRPASAGRQTA